MTSLATTGTVVAAAASRGKTLWYLGRATGVVSTLLLSASVVLGLLSSARVATRDWPRFVIQGLHRNVSLLTVAFLGAHVATIVLDAFAPISWLDAVVPFVSGYRPMWVGLGTVGVDLLLAVIVTSLLRTRIGERPWRAVHWLAYAAWPVAVLHGIGIGSDRHERWFLALTVAAVAIVVATAAWRWTRRAPDTPLVVRGRIHHELRRSA